MAKAVVISAVLLPLLSIPLIYGLSKLDMLKKQPVFLSGLLGALVITFGGTALFFYRNFKKVDPIMHAFSFFSFFGVISLQLALQMDGYLPKDLIDNYIKKSEPYLLSSYGTMVSYWDGTVQTILCIAAIGLYAYRESHREVALFWAGSILNEMMTGIPGALIGPHKVGNIALNLIYFGLPLLITVRYLHRSPIQARSFIKFPAIWRRPVDLLFLVFFKVAALYAVFRLLTVLGGNASCMKDYLKSYDPYLKDSNMFPKMQTLNYGYFFVAYYCMTIYGLLFPGQHWMADWAIIHAGAAAQAQFSYVGGSLHHRTAKGMHPPSSGQAAYIYWIANILLFVVPQLFAFWCHRDPEKYGRTFTIDLAQPVKTYVVKRVTTTSTTSRSPAKYD